MMSDRTTDNEMLLKRGQFMAGMVVHAVTLGAYLAGGAYVYGRMTEKLDHIAIALTKIDSVPARVLVLEQSDREFDRRLVDVERRLREMERPRTP